MIRTILAMNSSVRIDDGFDRTYKIVGTDIAVTNASKFRIKDIENHEAPTVYYPPQVNVTADGSKTLACTGDGNTAKFEDSGRLLLNDEIVEYTSQQKRHLRRKRQYIQVEKQHYWVHLKSADRESLIRRLLKM